MPNIDLSLQSLALKSLNPREVVALLDWSEIVLRLGVATLAGGLIGLNRDLQGKPIGLKTLGVVGLATAMVVVLATLSNDPTKISDAASRVMQGILTGIGFLGAGVIVRAEHDFRVRGLTSAACTWLTACMGIACGLGQWRIVAIALVFAFALLIVGRRLERWLHRMLGGKDDPAQNSLASSPPPPD
jgi:putative Mg2+ transporter-C (MgtC) family protein